MDDLADLAISEELRFDIEVARIRQSFKNSNTTNACLCCGVEIPVERREVIPNCDFCITCQSKNDEQPAHRHQSSVTIFDTVEELENESEESE